MEHKEQKHSTSANSQSHTAKSLLANIRLLHQLIGAETTLLAILLEHYPYFTSPNILHTFQQHRQAYDRYFDACQAFAQQSEFTEGAVKNIDKLQTDCLGTQKKIHTILQQLLAESIPHCADEEVQQTLQSFVTYGEQFSQLRDTILKPLTDKAALENQLQQIKTSQTAQAHALIQKIQTLKQNLATKIDLNQLRQSQFAARCRLSVKEFEWAKWQQHSIVALRQRLSHIDTVLEPDQELVVELPNRWLKASDYLDLLLITQLIKPTATLTAISNQQRLLAESHTLLQKNLTILHSRLGDDFMEIFRQQVITNTYQQWQQQLQQVSDSKPTSAWKQLLQHQQQLTYTKRGFFQHHLRQQPLGNLVSRLLRQIEQQPQTAQQLLQQLQKQKTELTEKITTSERSLQPSAKWWQKTAATLWLAVNQQPDFQLGQLAARTTRQQLDRHAPTKTLRQPLPPALAHQLENAVGSSFLGISLAVTQYVGYYPHAITAINRTLTAQINPLLRAGNYLHTALSHRGIPRSVAAYPAQDPDNASTWHKALRLIQLDEIGILEKEQILHWCNGLLLNLLLSSQPALVSTGAYLLASLTSRAAMGWVDRISGYWQLSPELQQTAKFVVHLGLYTQAYRQGLLWAQELGFYRAPTIISYNEALQRFGFNTEAKASDIQRRYRELSRQFHPDKCPTPICEEQMLAVNEAYDVLKQTFKH